MFEVSHDVLVRVAAYLTIYGTCTPSLVAATTWPSKPGVAAVVEGNVGASPRAHRPHPHSTRRNGEGSTSTPSRDQVWHFLTAGHCHWRPGGCVGKTRIRTRDGSRNETVAEIEFELRLACGLAELSRWRQSSSWSTLDQAAYTFLREQFHAWTRLRSSTCSLAALDRGMAPSFSKEYVSLRSQD